MVEKNQTTNLISAEYQEMRNEAHEESKSVTKDDEERYSKQALEILVVDQAQFYKQADHYQDQLVRKFSDTIFLK